MSLILHANAPISRHLRDRSERRQYRLLYALAFPLCLVVALGARAVGHRPAGAPKSILTHAKALAGSTIPFVFMG